MHFYCRQCPISISLLLRNNLPSCFSENTNTNESNRSGDVLNTSRNIRVSFDNNPCLLYINQTFSVISEAFLLDLRISRWILSSDNNLFKRLISSSKIKCAVLKNKLTMWWFCDRLLIQRESNIIRQSTRNN